MSEERDGAPKQAEVQPSAEPQTFDAQQGEVPNSTPTTVPVALTETPAGRPFEVDGAAWLAFSRGGGVYGTGRWALAPLEAIQFARAEAPEARRCEALLAAGRFESLYPEELAALFRSAKQMVQPDPNAPARPVRFRRGEDQS